MTEPIVLTVITVIINILVLTIGGTWKIAEVKSALVDVISEAKDIVDQKQREHEAAVDQRLAALLDDLRRVELYCRDTFLRRDSFQEVNRANSESMRIMGDKIDARFDRIETKIDAHK